ncbi:MAG: hypothetical protein F7B18_01685 [Desulfurococcales archaeon]|nr:hypothetical protein [Desulfurococcales archaeon]
MEYPIINYKPALSGETDQPLHLQLVDLEKLSAQGHMRVVHHAGEKGYHIKLVLNSREAISLFVWNDKVFKSRNTLARSYGVIPIEEIEVDEDEGDRLIAEGSYRLQNGILELRIEKSYDEAVAKPCTCRYRLRLKGVKEYISPKHGHSTRPEYYLIALRKP